MYRFLSQLYQRVRYEIIYSWPGWRNCSTFNPGYWPLDPDIASDAKFAPEPNQIQLYAELLRTGDFTRADRGTGRYLKLQRGAGVASTIFKDDWRRLS